MMIIIKKLTLWLSLFCLKSSYTRKGQAELLVTNDVSCARGTCFFWWWWWGIEKGKDARFLDKLSYLRSIWSDLGWTFRSAETTCNLYARLSISTHLCHQLITKWSPNSQKWLLSFSLVNYQFKHLAPPLLKALFQNAACSQNGSWEDYPGRTSPPPSLVRSSHKDSVDLRSLSAPAILLCKNKNKQQITICLPMPPGHTWTVK